MTENAPARTLLQTIEHMAETASEEGCAIPFLWGVPQIVAVPMIALAVQMSWGREEPWLPAKVAARQINKDGLSRTAKGGRKWVGWIEKIARPRLTFLTGKGPERLIGVFLVVFCASILLPIPGTNSVPALGVALAAFGLVQRDGLLVIFGLIVGIAWISLLLIGGMELIRYLLGLIGVGSGAEADVAYFEAFQFYV